MTYYYHKASYGRGKKAVTYTVRTTTPSPEVDDSGKFLIGDFIGSGMWNLGWFTIGQYKWSLMRESEVLAKTLTGAFPSKVSGE